jgi:hypothetical protein
MNCLKPPLLSYRTARMPALPVPKLVYDTTKLPVASVATSGSFSVWASPATVKVAVRGLPAASYIRALTSPDSDQVTTNSPWLSMATDASPGLLVPPRTVRSRTTPPPLL